MKSVPVSAIDVAAYIVLKKGSMSAMKLQKLVYYCQAWSLVWDGVPIFKEELEAWRDGPIVRELFNQHKGLFVVDHITGNPKALSSDQVETVEAILADYGSSDGATLSQMTHDEAPWREAREGVQEGENSENVITHESMARFYSAL
jgi:uncharacterized phage-associated protein